MMRLLLLVSLTVWGTISAPARADAVETALARVREIHGDAGPWAVTGYRIGQAALAALRLPRHSFSLDIRHRAPAQVQYSCIVDGVQAATGASPGKLNLRHEIAALEAMETIAADRRSGRTLHFRLRPAFVASILDVPYPQFEEAARRVLALPDAEIFDVAPSVIR